MVQTTARPKPEVVEEPHGAGYDEDFFLWTQGQAALLRDAAARGLDVPFDLANLAEEIESLGRRDRRGVGNRVARIIEHLLKLQHSPAVDPRRGWRLVHFDYYWGDRWHDRGGGDRRLGAGQPGEKQKHHQSQTGQAGQ